MSQQYKDVILPKVICKFIGILVKYFMPISKFMKPTFRSKQENTEKGKPQGKPALTDINTSHEISVIKTVKCYWIHS